MSLNVVELVRVAWPDVDAALSTGRYELQQCGCLVLDSDLGTHRCAMCLRHYFLRLVARVLPRVGW